MIKDNSFKIHSLLHSSYSLCTMSYTGCNTLKYFSHLLITGSFPISICHHHQLSSFPRITDTIINLLSNCTYFCITVTLHSNYCSSATLNSLFHCILHILLNSDILPLPSLLPMLFSQNCHMKLFTVSATVIAQLYKPVIVTLWNGSDQGGIIVVPWHLPEVW